MNIPTNESALFPRGDLAPADYFTGHVWLNILAPNEAGMHCQVANVLFEPGARTSWHMHEGGQVLLVTDGVGHYQEKGKPIRVIHKGDAIIIAPGIEHWHGASPDKSVTHIAINPNSENGVVKWLKPVTDAEYRNL